MQNPIVSIIMPTQNRSDKISKSIQSVRDQTFQDWELLVIDDKSSDNTELVVKGLAEQDNRISYIYNTGKKGVPYARNCGLENARGEYIAFLDSDDIWLKHHLKDSLAAMEKYGKKVCFALWYEVFGDIRKPIDDIDKEMFEREFKHYRDKTDGNVICFSNMDFLEHLLFESFYCYHINTLVLKRSVFIDNDFVFNEKLHFNEDTDLTFRVIMKYGFCLIKDYHYEYYHWDDSMYNFIDRREPDLDTITHNVSRIEKILKHGKYKIEYYKILKQFVKKSPLVEDKKKWLVYFNTKIATKLFTMGFVTSALKKRRGYRFYLLSLYYHLNPDVVKYVWMYLWSGNREQIQFNTTLLDFK